MKNIINVLSRPNRFIKPVRSIGIIILLTVCPFIHGFSQETEEISGSKGVLKKDAEFYFKEQNYLAALPFYLKLAEMDSSNSDYLYYAGICFLYKSDEISRSVEYLEKVFAKNQKTENIQYYLGRAYHLNYRFDDAIKCFNNTLALPKLPEDIKKSSHRYIEVCLNAKELVHKKVNVEIENLGLPVSTGASEYFPVITADEFMLIFTYRGPKSKGGRMDDYGKPDQRGQYFEDVMVAYRLHGGGWSEPHSISDSVNTKNHDACIAISADGQKLFTYKDNPGYTSGDIYMSNLDSNEWTVPVRLNKINSNSWEGSASISPNLNTIYFSSERSGGFGGRDIYFSKMLPNGEWGVPENIGETINTPYDEDAPFIHPDGRSLYFCSTGHNSIGGYDIFISHLVRKGAAGKNSGKGNDTLSWSKPENIGYPVNTTGDDKYYVVTANGLKGYYSSDSPGGNGLFDIYCVKQNISHILMLVKGNVYADDAPVQASIKVLNASSKEMNPGQQPAVQGLHKSNAATGKYLLALPAGGGYDASFELAGFAVQKDFFDASRIDSFVEIIRDVNFYSDDYALKYLTVNGVVKSISPETKPAPGITVYFKSMSGKFRERAVTGANGFFKFRKVPQTESYLISLSSGKDAAISGYALTAGKGFKGLGINDTKTDDIGYYEISVKGGLAESGPGKIITVKGTIRDADSKNPIEASIELADNRINEIIASFKSTGEGTYLIPLVAGKNYGMAVKADGYLFYSENFDLPANAPAGELNKDVDLKKIEVGNKIILKNIFFDFNKATLRPESTSELERLVGALNDIPTLKIEISGHTDSKGSDKYNQKLSQSRAKTVVEYLIIQGIAKDRLVFAGYGESAPIASNDTGEGRQLNRRTEFKVISK